MLHRERERAFSGKNYFLWILFSSKIPFFFRGAGAAVPNMIKEIIHVCMPLLRYSTPLLNDVSPYNMCCQVGCPFFNVIV